MMNTRPARLLPGALGASVPGSSMKCRSTSIEIDVCFFLRTSASGWYAASSLVMTARSGCVPLRSSCCTRESGSGASSPVRPTPVVSSKISEANARASVNFPTPCGPWKIHAWCTRPDATASRSSAAGFSCPSTCESASGACTAGSGGTGTSCSRGARAVRPPSRLDAGRFATRDDMERPCESNDACNGLGELTGTPSFQPMRSPRAPSGQPRKSAACRLTSPPAPRSTPPHETPQARQRPRCFRNT